MQTFALALLAFGASVSAQGAGTVGTSGTAGVSSAQQTALNGPTTGVVNTATTQMNATATATRSGGAVVAVATRTVKVSNAQASLFFSPDSLSAAVGDTIVFEFNPKNHSVVQSNFQNPCIPLAQSQSGAVGFNSGFMPVADNSTTKKTFTIKVANTQPIWYYCAQGKHCQMGMVGVINPPAASPQNNIVSFKALAASATAAATPSSIVSVPYATATESAGATPAGYTTGGGSPTVDSSASASAASATKTGAAAPTGAGRVEVYAGLAMAGAAIVAGAL